MSAILFSLGSFPSTFYITAGKNSFVTAVPFIFLFFYFLFGNTSNNWKQTVLSNLLVFTITLIHYPSGVMTDIGLGAYYLFNLKQIRNALLHLPGLILGGIWGFQKYFLYYQVPLNPVYLQYREPSKIVSFENIKRALISIWKQCIVYIGEGWAAKIILGLSIIAFIYLFYSFFHIKQVRWLGVAAGINLIAMIVYELSKSPELRFVFITQVLLSFTIFYFGAAFTIGELAHSKLEHRWKFTLNPLLVILIVYSGYSAFNLYKMYQSEQLANNMVTKYAIDVYQRIEENIHQDDIILNNSIMGTSRRIFPTDAGGWIPAFSYRKISMPFSEFSTLDTYENHLLHQELIKDPGNCETMQKLLDRGITYYYRGRYEIYGPSITIDDQYVQSGL